VAERGCALLNCRGARDRDTLSSIEALEYDFRKAQRLLVPEASDWSAAGKVMARLAIRYDYEAVGKGDY